MTKQTIIPAGYRVTITSWENDADNYADTIHEGLTKERVEFILELCNLFLSKNGQYGKKGKGFGNMYEPGHDEQLAAEAAIRVVMEKHRAVLTEDELEQLAIESDPDDEYGGPEFSEMVSTFLDSSEDYYYRVYSGAKVELIPHEIRMEDVTDQFST